MPRALTRDQVRDVDRRAIDEYGLPGIVLMENAGRGAAELLLRSGPASRVVICAGKGNNGGDGFVIARHLDLAGVDVRVLLFCKESELTGDAAVNYRVIVRSGLPVVVWNGIGDGDRVASELGSADWLVDALLGTGTRGEVREPYRSAIAAINRAGRKVFAVDLPSGMDCDTGQPLGECVRADLTATFVARKVGFDVPGAERWTGRVHVVGIGVPRRLLQESAGD